MNALELPLIASWAQVLMLGILIAGSFVAYRVLITVRNILSRSEQLLTVTKGWAREAATRTDDTKHVVVTKTDEVQKAVEAVPEKVVEAIMKPPSSTLKKPDPPGQS